MFSVSSAISENRVECFIDACRGRNSEAFVMNDCSPNCSRVVQSSFANHFTPKRMKAILRTKGKVKLNSGEPDYWIEAPTHYRTKSGNVSCGNCTQQDFHSRAEYVVVKRMHTKLSGMELRKDKSFVFLTRDICIVVNNVHGNSNLKIVYEFRRVFFCGHR